jgi:transcriptional regulator with XRE-family HTH domain
MTPQILKTWRQGNGYSQSQLAKALNVATMTVSRWERGVREIPPFLHLALRCLELEGGESKTRSMKTEKEVNEHGSDLSKG